MHSNYITYTIPLQPFPSIHLHTIQCLYNIQFPFTRSNYININQYFTSITKVTINTSSNSPYSFHKQTLMNLSWNIPFHKLGKLYHGPICWHILKWCSIVQQHTHMHAENSLMMQRHIIFFFTQWAIESSLCRSW